MCDHRRIASARADTQQQMRRPAAPSRVHRAAGAPPGRGHDQGAHTDSAGRTRDSAVDQLGGTCSHQAFVADWHAALRSRCRSSVRPGHDAPTPHLRDRGSCRPAVGEHERPPLDNQLNAVASRRPTVVSGRPPEVVALKVGGSSPLGHPRSEHRWSAFRVPRQGALVLPVVAQGQASPLPVAPESQLLCVACSTACAAAGG